MSKNYKDTALAAVVASLLTLGGFLPIHRSWLPIRRQELVMA